MNLNTPEDASVTAAALSSHTANEQQQQESPQQAHPQPQRPLPQQQGSSRDLASQSFPQQTNQPRLQSQPIQTSSSPPPLDVVPPVQTCAQCELQMQGSFVRALGATYHLNCFKCLDCDQIVASKFFPITEPTGRQYPLCERDYFRRLGLVCHSCGEALRGSYITALDNKYHIEHFTCSICPTVFGPRDSYYEHDGKVYCHYHYSIYYAVKCAGCRTAILKQFVEINRNSQDEHWHPECYMIHKFWNVKLSFAPQGEDDQIQTPQVQGQIETADSAGGRPSLEQKTPEELKRAQQQMEEKVLQIWTVLSGFEESSAGCISDMLVHVSDAAYYDGVQMAEKFILHVEILFNAIDDLEAQMKEVGDQSDLEHGRQAKMLCKKIVNFFSLLSYTQESGVRRLGMTQELLSLVTGIAHYLKILIRIALTRAFKLERQYNSTTVIARFVSKLTELGSRDKHLQNMHGKGAMDAEVTSDLCLSCRITIEDECFTFDHHNRWHPNCLICSGCTKSLAPVYQEASFDTRGGAVLCQQCKTPDAQIGFSHVTKLQQYTFLLRVALIRLENLLHLKDDDGMQGAIEYRGRELPALSPTGALSQGLARKDSRSKTQSPEGSRTNEAIAFGDIRRVKSTHLDRDLSNSARFPRRQTLIEHQRKKPEDQGGQHGKNTIDHDGNAHLLSEALLEFEIIDETEILNDAEEREQMDGQKPKAPMTLSSLTEKLRINTSLKRPPNGSRVPGLGNRQESQILAGGPRSADGLRQRKRQYLSELSALELFIVQHMAVLTLAPIVADYFTLEELLDLIGQRKPTLWGRFVKNLKTEKKKTKAEGTFGVPLEVLVERNGVDSSLGAGPGRIRIPSFIDDSITAMRNMDMSVEGVFRKNGNIRRLKELSEAIDKDPGSVNFADDNPVQVAALLKKFLRDLPDPLLTFKLHRLFVVSQKVEDPAVRRLILHLACCLLPKVNRDSMEAICLFLCWVAGFSHVDEETGSKMDLHNLATVITPNILYSKSKDPIKDESFLAIEAVMGLLENQDDFCLVPEDLSLILNDQDLLESSMDLSSKDILKRCENLVRAQGKKTNITAGTGMGLGAAAAGDSHLDSVNANNSALCGNHGQDEGHHPGLDIRHQSLPVHNNANSRQQSAPLLIQQPQHHQRPHYNNGIHGLSTSNPSPSSTSMGPMRIPERPQAVSVGGGKGATPMSL
ncbi:hypothetical protein BX616_011173 [Lobosporangium transversale]|uniref:Rho-type GTPase-activating protein 1 n=1 Tax=Lobosporangium transversale TaxID=64571 RepID=A0A1Y2GQE5_9FUNG|nr:hypothetical protein BCR41DRAFT_396287 [Lobosporangium transversale]KAF9909408.1 hypothetical protein BX616_011173 [Lobosporangium transversale]ORZ16144.1 hypothetical protein BCR41DRAFT_396287 [Lobosporangium transversale]|eukprot:XP_021881491.1 hypothetical protein BCR41DRAFT_396287 [Lobosporangium transversale]